jgi:two-component system OmpR family sensor kinase
MGNLRVSRDPSPAWIEAESHWPRHTPLTLRLRLTFWYSAVLAFIIALFGMVVYGGTSLVLNRQMDMSMVGTAETIINISHVRTSFDGQQMQLVIPRLDRLGVQRTIVQFWDTQHKLVSASDNYPSQDPLDPDGLSQQNQSFRNLVVAGLHLRVLTYPVEIGADHTVIGYLQVATPLETIAVVQNVLLLVLVGGGVAAVALAAIAGWLSAHRALKPLDAMTETALQITRTDDLSRRIALTGEPHDEIGRLAQAFNETLERLERLFNAQRRFLADVSHELRTPLTTIRGNVDLLRRMGGADETSLDAIQSEAERMSRLVGDLLLLAQSDAGTLPTARQPVELDTLLFEVYREAQVLAGGVVLSIGEIDQAIVLGDRDRLYQLMLNLVSNALKFTPEGGKVNLGLSKVNDWARLVVTDTGVGIPPEELPQVFERFYRVDKARTRSQGGAGLGLAIAQRIAHIHGGRIEVASDGVNGHGSTFSVWLPLAREKNVVDVPRLNDAKTTTAPLAVVKKAGG